MEVFLEILRPDQVRSDKAEIAPYGVDWCKHFTSNPCTLLLPETVSEVVEIIKVANKERISIVPSGGRTGLSGGAAATNNEAILSLEKLNKKIEVSPIDRCVVCDAGCVTDVVKEKVSELGLYLPVDFTASGSSQIGGNIATDVGGVHVISDGNIRDWVLGMKVVTGDGKLLDLGGALYKDRTGYDLYQLFIGSEGTLGVVVEATLRLTTPPRDTMRALCGINDLGSVLKTYHGTRNAFPSLRLCEYFPRNALELVLKHQDKRDPFQGQHPCYLLLEIEVEAEEVRERFEVELSNLMEQGSISDVVVAQGSKQSDELLALRELISETTSAHYTSHRNDISVPISAIPDFVKDLNLELSKTDNSFEVVTYGHIGDGNLHINILKPADMADELFFSECKSQDPELFKIVQKYRGSISAEHGVGLLKKGFLEFSRSKEEINYMRAIKKNFDPNGILNPGKIFD